jgi:hypothetical protein
MSAVVRAALLSLALTACGADDEVEGYSALERHVTNNRVGGDADNWIEMKNKAGEWERTGLIFGYLGDYDECQKAIAGLKAANYAREYRCVPAN